jgi:hypothetical protein
MTDMIKLDHKKKERLSAKDSKIIMLPVWLV